MEDAEYIDLSYRGFDDKDALQSIKFFIRSS